MKPSTYRSAQYSENRHAITCSRCLFDNTVPGIEFDAAGECSYCLLHDRMEAQYPRGGRGEHALASVVEKMKLAGRSKSFDCIVGVSGGCDSSYLVHTMVERGLRPLAVHFDNTWNSPTATRNIFNVLEALGVPLWTYVVDHKEYDDIYRSFMLAGVRDVEAPTDIGLMATLYRAAEEHGVRYIVEGHSFRTEGVSPPGWLYMDGRYVASVHRLFGTVPMRTFPNMPLTSFVKWAAWSGFKRIRPLYYMDYDESATRAFLSERFNWQWYGGHHLENRFTAFYHSYFLPTRFGIDTRVIGLSALVRTGQLERDKAEAIISTAPFLDPEVLNLVKKRLRFNDAEFERVMTSPHRSFREYSTYESTFRLMKPIWWALYRTNRVPKSFYVKFCGGKVRH